ncbi:hypothetical protein JTB14_005957 [Gonioctena quinquepunctata]|nr:hypothetical protein JTB14_005957 [Gonioctena quinquepunctata]
MMEAEQERCRFLNRGWTSRQLIELVNNYINAFQLEIDRNVDTLMILTDYYIGAITKLPNEEGFLKEILPKYDFDDPEIFACITNVLENVDQENNENPLDATIKASFNKALAVAHKVSPMGMVNFEKGKSKLLPSGEREKANKKQKKTEKGMKVIFEPDEEVKKNAGKLFDEWSCALLGENIRLSIRLNLLKFDLKRNADLALNSMKKATYSIFDRIRSKYKEDINCITEACNFLGRAIEAEIPIQEELLFKDDKFFVNKNTIFFPDPITFEKPQEIRQDRILTITQLEKLTNILFDLAPAGLIAERSFIYVLQDMLVDNVDIKKVNTPKLWSEMTVQNVEELSKILFGDHPTICWKHFIVYNFMVPFPSVEELLSMRRMFVELDRELTERISEEQFEGIRFWFETTPDDLRTSSIRNLIYKLYRVHDNNFNYTAMLLDFCKGDSTLDGFAKALALSLGRALCWDEEIGQRFVEETSEKRILHEEEVRIRNEERHEAEEFMKSLLNKTIDETVHKCESLIIEELLPEPDVLSLASSRKLKTNDNIQVKIFTAYEDTSPSEGSSDKSTEVGFEANSNPNIKYFIELDVVLSVLMNILSWSYDVQNIEEQSFSEILEDIFNDCRNPDFNNEVLSHEFLNNAKLLKLLNKTSIFVIKNPPEIVEELIDRNEY